MRDYVSLPLGQKRKNYHFGVSLRMWLLVLLGRCICFPLALDILQW